MAINYSLFQFPCVTHVFCVFQRKSVSHEGLGNISKDTCENIQTIKNNRQEFFNELRPLGLREIAESRQVHGDRVIIRQTGCDTEHLEDADGMITASKGLGLMIKTADCQPILIADQKGAHIMAIHAGWRGNRMNFPQSAINLFCKTFNLPPEELLAVRGPSLGPSCAEFVNFEREWSNEFLPWYNRSTRCMNLWQLTRDQLLQSGLLPQNIFGLDICTKLNNQDYFSYRHDRKCGRQASIIWIADK